ncbi:hypothetical protein [Thioclava sediminum]|uniref:hypothetical protein n=1 Tax=Thioclava sediminum TaxID=1915319 RepID=UPI0011BAC6E5|nr:hypothetical protein [Thioclava sediminum]
MAIYLAYIGIWILNCVPPLLQGKHEAFQASGTIIICFAILRIGLDRAKYEESISKADRETIVSAINRLEAHRELNEQRLALTFDIHMSLISKGLLKSGIENTYGPNTEEENRALCFDIERTIGATGGYYAVPEDNDLAKAITDLKLARDKYAPWKNRLFRIEIAFLVIGTLQSGYGAAFSRWLQENNILIYILDKVEKFSAFLF